MGGQGRCAVADAAAAQREATIVRLHGRPQDRRRSCPRGLRGSRRPRLRGAENRPQHPLNSTMEMPRPAPAGTPIVPSAATSIGGSIRSGLKYRRLAATSPGSVRVGERPGQDECSRHARCPTRASRRAAPGCRARRFWVVQPDRFAEPADAAGLDVDDPARAGVDCLFREPRTRLRSSS